MTHVTSLSTFNPTEVKDFLKATLENKKQMEKVEKTLKESRRWFQMDKEKDWRTFQS